MLLKDQRIILKIIQRIDSVISYCESVDYEEFTSDTKLNEACVFNLLQIGEMCNKDLSDNFKEKFNTIPWRQIYGLRNRIVHGYDDVQLNIIWETIIDDLPTLSLNLKNILEQINES